MASHSNVESNGESCSSDKLQLIARTMSLEAVESALKRVVQPGPFQFIAECEDRVDNDSTHFKKGEEGLLNKGNNCDVDVFRMVATGLAVSAVTRAQKLLTSEEELVDHYPEATSETNLPLTQLLNGIEEQDQRIGIHNVSVFIVGCQRVGVVVV